ncbi:MAG TPA: replicative DNA helicase [Melioribacteraceae bacterium]|nr:replicative DNA helicase [Melioribacteraceae bacterium]
MNEDLTAGRKLPAIPEIEQLVLGAMLIDKEAQSNAFALLRADAFYDFKNKVIFEAMIALDDAKEPIDFVSTLEEVKKIQKKPDINFAVYLAELSQNVTSAANSEYHCRLVLEKWILRQIISISHELAAKAYDQTEDVFDLLDNAEGQIFKIAELGLKQSYTPFKEAIQNALEYIESIHSKTISNYAVPTGFFELDDMLGGLQKSDLLIVAARPAMGKTAFALSLARNAALEHNVPIALFSLEMSTVQLATRFISSEARINSHLLRTGKFRAEEGQKISKVVDRLIKAPIYIDDTPGQSVMEIRAKCRRLKAEKNIGLIIIDYLQLMTASARVESREREISTISRSLKALAKELDVPVIALSQLNRAVEEQKDKRPMLSHLRESGAIEQDADIVMFLYRPSVYGITQFSDGTSTEGIAEVIIAKHRNGPTGDVKMAFLSDFARYENLELIHRDIPSKELPS